MRSNGGGMGMPFSFMMPMFNESAPARDSSVPDIIVPARVNKAMEFIGVIHSKTMKRVAANDITVMEVEGDKLCPEEENARDAALNCLAQYFDGKLQPDIWEKARHDAVQKQLATNGKEGTLIRCFGCNSAYPSPSCPLCHGKGKLFVQGVGDDEVSYLAQMAVMNETGKYSNPEEGGDNYGEEYPPLPPPSPPTPKKPKKPKPPQQ